eukprot:s14_g27.t1
MAAALRLSRLLRHLATQSVAAPAETFRGWVVNAEKGSLKRRDIDRFAACSQLPQQDPAANVVVNVHYSDLNYKDAMILQGQHGVVRKFPIVPGIDFAGVVVESHSPLWNPGDEVVLTGNKIGQHFDGGYAEFCRVQAEWLVAKPKVFNLEESSKGRGGGGWDGATDLTTTEPCKECMMIGTAGFTAMQMVMELEEAGRLGQIPGPVLVLGAAGGAGSAAVAILAQLGHHVVASSGRADQLADYLKGPPGETLMVAGIGSAFPKLDRLHLLGAKEVIGRLEPTGLKKPLQEQRWAAVDAAEWQRNRDRRLEIWRRIATDLPVQALRHMHEATIPLEELPAWGDKLVSGMPTARAPFTGR